MRNSILKLEKSIGKIGYQITRKNINSACCVVAYQEKLPESVKKLREF
ncbi:cyclic lactone autoinducer peptide [[Clostridium] polysaccharolyticum]|uniref:Cyclic lactone autoinducer peptide n=1 Tax=[Clostridium] polysaccharolyticum TaxID=29364 RepID=A0A1I0D0N8_9FIRM|nr:cyclic lactone autoinducer peptide [[Clostridium] polysaccharolyticum]SET25636.1 cyclic lactone autoinducer peptide [[Clostridium] polysaccharolyticum]